MDKHRDGTDITQNMLGNKRTNRQLGTGEVKTKETNKINTNKEGTMLRNGKREAFYRIF